MKLFQLAGGLTQLAANVGLLVLTARVLYPACQTVPTLLALGVVTLFATVLLSARGTENVMQALFGNEGLLYDMGRRMESDTAREERELPPRQRPTRITHPSSALRIRGASGRVRVPRARCRS